MTLKDIAQTLFQPAQNAINFIVSPKQYIQDAVEQIKNYSYRPAQFDIPNIIASQLGGGSEAYRTTEQIPIYPFRPIMTDPKADVLNAIQTGSKALLENILPAFIGTVPIPPVTGWSLPRAIGTTAGFTGLQKAAGYENKDIFNPVNLGLSFLAGGAKFGQPEPVSVKNTVKIKSSAQEARKYKSAEEFVKAQTFSTNGIKHLNPNNYSNLTDFIRDIEKLNYGKSQPVKEIETAKQLWGNRPIKGAAQNVDVNSISFAEKPLAIKPTAGRSINEPIQIQVIDGKNVLVDGRHRLDQAIANGDKTIPAIVEGGSTISRLTNFYNQVTQPIKIKGEAKVQTSKGLVGELPTTIKIKQEAPIKIKQPTMGGGSQGGPKTPEGTAFSRLFSEWIGKRQSSLTTALEKGKEFKKIPQELTWDIVKELESPSKTANKEVKNYALLIRNEYNKLYAEASKFGIDISYLKNYITHIWKENPQQVAQLFKSARGRFKYAKERYIPTYEEGIQLGLTPKYQHISQIMTEYIRKLNETKANVEFLRKLKDEGLVVSAQKAGGDPSYSPIIAPGFPQSKQIIRGENYFSPYYARTDIANIINRVFSEQKSSMSNVARLSSAAQDIVMSGGGPKTPANAWSIAQLIKEFTAGRVVDPIRAFFRSFSGKASNEFFQKNLGQIKKMQERNIPVSTTYNVESMVSKGAIKDTFGENFVQAWNKIVNEPTFKRFLPQLEIELFNSVEKKAIKRGMSETKAADVAATSVRKFYGVTGSDKLALSSQFSKDIKSAFFFAPRYRESMINFWIESGKALRNPLALENQTNIRFLIGTVLTYFVMNEINRQSTGKPMNENPPGTEDKMLIKLPDGTILGIPFLSSIATMPRLAYRVGRRLLKGDISGAGAEARGTMSVLLRPLADVVVNQDYFQRPIAKEGMTPEEKYKAIGQYLFSQYLSHPYLREIFDPRNSSDPAYQRLSRAMEMPFRFYTENSLKGKFYYAARDEALQGLNDRERSAFNALPKYDANNYDPNSTILKYQMYLTYPKVFEAKQKTELEMFAKTGQPIDPLYLVNYETAKKYMRYETLPPGSQDRKDMVKAYPELVALFDVRSQYFNQNPIQRQVSSRPLPSADIQAAMDRKDWNYPGVREYLDANKQYQNQQRQLLGLTPLADYQSKYRSYVKKLKISKVASKLPKIKIKKPPKIKILTKKKVKNIVKMVNSKQKV